MGDFMGVMPKVVSVALIGSVLVDHFVIPTLAARWYKQHTPVRDQAAIFAAVSEARSCRAVRDCQPNPPEPGSRHTTLCKFAKAGTLEPRCGVTTLCLGASSEPENSLANWASSSFLPATEANSASSTNCPLGYSIEENLGRLTRDYRATRQVEGTRPGSQLCHFSRFCWQPFDPHRRRLGERPRIWRSHG